MVNRRSQKGNCGNLSVDNVWWQADDNTVVLSHQGPLTVAHLSTICHYAGLCSHITEMTWRLERGVFNWAHIPHVSSALLRYTSNAVSCPQHCSSLWAFSAYKSIGFHSKILYIHNYKNLSWYFWKHTWLHSKNRYFDVWNGLKTVRFYFIYFITSHVHVT